MAEGNEGKVIINYKDLNVVLSDKADSQTLDLLNNTVLGSKGGMRYQITDAEDRIKAYKKNIRFISLWKKKRLFGTVGFCYRLIRTADKEFHSSYLRYFAFLPGFQVADDSGKYPERKREQSLADTLKNRILAFFRRPGILDFPHYSEDDPRILYAYVESMNRRSKNIIDQIGFQHVRSFLTVAFSRFNPKDYEDVVKLADDKRETMLQLFDDFYSDYSFYNNENVRDNGSIYIIRKGDKIIAGLSVLPTVFRLYEMPGVWGWVFMNVLHRLPYYRKIFRPHELRFLTFEMMYHAEGMEEELEKLMETACAREGINMGLCWLDDRSRLYDTLRTRINMGAINRMLNAKPGLVFARFININTTDQEHFFDRPAFISGFDFT